MTVESNTSGYEFTGGMTDPNPSYVSSSSITSYSGGGKKVTKKKRRPLTKKAKVMSKMRRRNMKQLSVKEKKIKKRMKHRKIRKNIIESIESGQSLPKQSLKKLTPNMQKFMSNIPPSTSSVLTPWPSMSDSGRGKKVSKKVGTRTLNSARKKLAEMLKKKPIYEKSQSTLRLSKFKKTPTKKKSLEKSKQKKKGHTRG